MVLLLLLLWGRYSYVKVEGKDWLGVREDSEKEVKLIVIYTRVRDRGRALSEVGFVEEQRKIGKT